MSWLCQAPDTNHMLGQASDTDFVVLQCNCFGNWRSPVCDRDPLDRSVNVLNAGEPWNF